MGAVMVEKAVSGLKNPPTIMTCTPCVAIDSFTLPTTA